MSGSASYPKKAPEMEKRLVMCIAAMELCSAVCLPFVFRECMTYHVWLSGLLVVGRERCQAPFLALGGWSAGT